MNMTERNYYSMPEAELIPLAEEDIVTSSFGEGNEDDLPID